MPIAPLPDLEAELEKELERVNDWSRALESMRTLHNMEGYVPNLMQEKAHLSKCRTILYCGGNRAGKCVGKEFKIYDPILGIEREVGSIDSDFHVLAFDGEGLRVTKAEKPFKKDIDDIYKVTLSNGGEFTCSMSHVVLTPGGFRTISDVNVGDELFLPQTILGSSRSTHGVDVRSFYQKAEGSRYDYRSLFRLSDELLRKGEGNVQDESPLRDDVQEPWYAWSSEHKGDQGNTQAYSHSYQEPNLLSSSDDPAQILAQHDDTLSDFSCTVLKSVDLSNGVVRKSIDESFPQRSISLIDQYPKCDDSILPFKTSCVLVTSISYVRNDYKWDFTVPVYHNYFANGCVHHNSTFGAMEMAYAMTKKYPDWYPMKKRFTRPVKGVVSATSFAVVLRVIEPKLNQLLPRNSYTVKRTAQSYPSMYKFIDGSTIDVLTLEMDDTAYESADWDIAWLDEPQSKRKYQAILRGLVDRRGRIAITFTPLTEPWMKEELVDRADGKTIDLFMVDIRDNRQTIKGTQILSEQAIREFEAEIPEDVRETRIHGKFFHLRGAVYQEFSEEHIKTFDYDFASPVICICDPHDRVPHHVIWAFIDKDDDIFVDYEWEGHVELPDLAAKIIEIEKARKYKIKRRLIDPNFGRKPYKAGSNTSVIRELNQNGCSFYEADDDVELGHMIVRDYLHYDRLRPVTLVNKPKLFFSRDRVPKTIRSVRNLQYEDWIGKAAGDRDLKEREKDKENHGADCIRYICISKPKSRAIEFKYELNEAPY